MIGAWGAIFSSLFGVWQSIPYLFADLWSLGGSPNGVSPGTRVDTKSWPYQACLYGIAVVPIVGLVVVNFETIQKTYAVVGALFVPMLAAVLLAMNGPSRWVGKHNANSLLTSAVLVGAMLFFVYAGVLEIHTELFAESLPAPN